jgi:hypothetical protein
MEYSLPPQPLTDLILAGRASRPPTMGLSGEAAQRIGPLRHQTGRPGPVHRHSERVSSRRISSSTVIFVLIGCLLVGHGVLECLADLLDRPALDGEHVVIPLEEQTLALDPYTIL